MLVNKDFEELVRVFYKNTEVSGYLKLTNKVQSLTMRICDKELIEDFEKNREKNFVFHCKKLKGSFISLFNCRLSNIRNGHSGDLEFTFNPVIYIDNSYEINSKRIEDIKLSSLTASYFNLHPLFQDLKENEEISGIFTYKNNEVIFKIKLISFKNSNQFESTERSKVCVTFRSKRKENFYYFEDLFYRFTIIVSFLSNSFIPSDYFSYWNTEKHSDGEAKVYYRGREQQFIERPALNKYKYVLKSDGIEIQNSIIAPMLSKNFKLWMHFVSTLRFIHQPIEDKFLSYYRCLESLAVHKVDSNQKYSNDEMKILMNNLEEILSASVHFSVEDIKHVKNSTREKNFKPGGDVIQTLIKEQLDLTSIKLKKEYEPLEKFIKSLKGLRDKLSHGRSYIIKQKDYERILSLKEVVKELLLKEQGINDTRVNLDYELEELDIEKMKESIREFEELEKSIEEELGLGLSFEEEKEKVERYLSGK